MQPTSNSKDHQSKNLGILTSTLPLQSKHCRSEKAGTILRLSSTRFPCSERFRQCVPEPIAAHLRTESREQQQNTVALRLARRTATSTIRKVIGTGEAPNQKALQGPKQDLLPRWELGELPSPRVYGLAFVATTWGENTRASPPINPSAQPQDEASSRAAEFSFKISEGCNTPQHSSPSVASSWRVNAVQPGKALTPQQQQQQQQQQC
ncbi:hypothetical protein QBC44DRAFT_387902 [Cladorrhinum sp. PSN332]|nr:hypothetical protein QBC44DRAFT_387902 [Cladorrhinum sp. PSN332]